MRSKAARPLLLLALALASAACGGNGALTPAQVAHHLREMDAYAPSGWILPSAARWAELYPDAKSEHGNAARRMAVLRENEHARVLLDAGTAIRPQLLEALKRPKQRLAAATLLGVLGGEEAAKGLLAAWREIRDRSQALGVYPSVGTPGFEENVGEEGVFGHNVVRSLCYVGRPVSSEIAADTTTAILATEALDARGERVRWREGQVHDGRHIEVVRYAHALDTAREGIRMLVMVGGSEVTPTLRRALDSPVRLVRSAALSQAGYLGPASEPLLPRVVELLAHPDHGRAAHTVLTDVY